MSEATTKEVKEVELKPIPESVQQLADKLRSHVKFDKNHVANDIDDQFIENLPPSMTPEIYKDYKEYKKTFAAAGALAANTESVDHMAKHKDVDTLTVKFGLGGNDSFTYETKRHVSYPNPKDRSKSVDTYGATRLIADESFGNKNTGAFGIVTQHTKKRAEKLLRED